MKGHREIMAPRGEVGKENRREPELLKTESCLLSIKKAKIGKGKRQMKGGGNQKKEEGSRKGEHIRKLITRRVKREKTVRNKRGRATPEKNWGVREVEERKRHAPKKKTEHS